MKHIMMALKSGLRKKVTLLTCSVLNCMFAFYPVALPFFLVHAECPGPKFIDIHLDLCKIFCIPFSGFSFVVLGLY